MQTTNEIAPYTAEELPALAEVVARPEIAEWLNAEGWEETLIAEHALAAVLSYEGGTDPDASAAWVLLTEHFGAEVPEPLDARGCWEAFQATTGDFPASADLDAAKRLTLQLLMLERSGFGAAPLAVAYGLWRGGFSLAVAASEFAAALGEANPFGNF